MIACVVVILLQAVLSNSVEYSRNRESWHLKNHPLTHSIASDETSLVSVDPPEKSVQVAANSDDEWRPFTPRTGFREQLASTESPQQQQSRENRREKRVWQLQQFYRPQTLSQNSNQFSNGTYLARLHSTGGNPWLQRYAPYYYPQNPLPPQPSRSPADHDTQIRQVVIGDRVILPPKMDFADEVLQTVHDAKHKLLSENQLSDHTSDISHDRSYTNTHHSEEAESESSHKIDENAGLPFENLIAEKSHGLEPPPHQITDEISFHDRNSQQQIQDHWIPESDEYHEYPKQHLEKDFHKELRHNHVETEVQSEIIPDLEWMSPDHFGPHKQISQESLSPAIDNPIDHVSESPFQLTFDRIHQTKRQRDTKHSNNFSTAGTNKKSEHSYIRPQVVGHQNSLGRNPQKTVSNAIEGTHESDKRRPRGYSEPKLDDIVPIEKAAVYEGIVSNALPTPVFSDFGTPKPFDILEGVVPTQIFDYKLQSNNNFRQVNNDITKLRPPQLDSIEFGFNEYGPVKKKDVIDHRQDVLLEFDQTSFISGNDDSFEDHIEYNSTTSDIIEPPNSEKEIGPTSTEHSLQENIPKNHTNMLGANVNLSSTTENSPTSVEDATTDNPTTQTTQHFTETNVLRVNHSAIPSDDRSTQSESSINSLADPAALYDIHSVPRFNNELSDSSDSVLVDMERRHNQSLKTRQVNSHVSLFNGFRQPNLHRPTIRRKETVHSTFKQSWPFERQSSHLRSQFDHDFYDNTPLSSVTNDPRSELNFTPSQRDKYDQLRMDSSRASYSRHYSPENDRVENTNYDTTSGVIEFIAAGEEVQPRFFDFVKVRVQSDDPAIQDDRESAYSGKHSEDTAPRADQQTREWLVDFSSPLITAKSDNKETTARTNYATQNKRTKSHPSGSSKEHARSTELYPTTDDVRKYESSHSLLTRLAIPLQMTGSSGEVEIHNSEPRSRPSKSPSIDTPEWHWYDDAQELDTWFPSFGQRWNDSVK